MEKQGLKFSILRVLAHQLQHWADFVSRQVGEEERTDLRNRTNAERTDTGSVADAPRVLSSPAPDMGSADVKNPAAHWLTRAGAGEPPGDWLARVQKGAPELLKQKGGSSRNAGTQPRTLPAAQADDSAQRTGISEITGAEQDSSRAEEPGKQLQEEDRVHRDEPYVSTSPDEVTAQSHALPAAQANGSAQKTDTGTGQRSRMTRIIQAAQDARRLAETSTREERGPRRDETHVPASPRNAAAQSYMLSSAPTVGDMPAADAGAGQRNRMTETMWSKKDSSELGKPGIDATLSPLGGWLSQPVQPGSSPWEERPGINANRPAGYNLWSQAGIAQPAQGHEWLGVSEKGAHIQAVTRWPSLPEEVTTDTQDWETAWRAWERQQRLDEEQRGSSWNA